MLGIFTLNLEVSQIIIDAVIELEFALLHLLEQSNGGHRFEGRADQIDRIRRGGSARPQIRVTVRAGPDHSIAGDQSDGG